MACVLESRYVLTGTAQLLREGSVPGDGEWIVVASPDHRRDSAPPDGMVSDLPGHPSASLSPSRQRKGAGQRRRSLAVGAGR